MVNSAAASNGAGKLLACTGQAAIQPIHDIHFVLSAVFIFDGSMAPTGQTLTHLPQFIHLLFRFGTTFKLPRRLYSWLPGTKYAVEKSSFASFSVIFCAKAVSSFLSSSSGRPAPNLRIIECSATAPIDATGSNPCNFATSVSSIRPSS